MEKVCSSKREQLLLLRHLQSLLGRPRIILNPMLFPIDIWANRILRGGTYSSDVYWLQFRMNERGAEEGCQSNIALRVQSRTLTNLTGKTKWQNSIDYVQDHRRFVNVEKTRFSTWTRAAENCFPTVWMEHCAQTLLESEHHRECGNWSKICFSSGDERV